MGKKSERSGLNRFRAYPLELLCCIGRTAARSMNPAAAAYENAHVTSLEAQLSRAVDSCMRLRPADPAAYIGLGAATAPRGRTPCVLKGRQRALFQVGGI